MSLHLSAFTASLSCLKHCFEIKPLFNYLIKALICCLSLFCCLGTVLMPQNCSYETVLFTVRTLLKVTLSSNITFVFVVIVSYNVTALFCIHSTLFSYHRTIQLSQHCSTISSGSAMKALLCCHCTVFSFTIAIQSKSSCYVTFDMTMLFCRLSLY
jgi:hypothetical protein